MPTHAKDSTKKVEGRTSSEKKKTSKKSEHSDNLATSFVPEADPAHAPGHRKINIKETSKI